MIHFHTNLKVIDNSGAKKIQCIKILRGSKHKCASIGNEIVVSVKKCAKNIKNNKNKVKKGQVHKALIIGTKKEFNRKNGTSIKFDNNIAVIINSEKNPLFTRIFTAIPYEIDSTKYSKVYSLAPAII